MLYSEAVKLHQKATEIFRSDKDWEEKYDLIFSNEISIKTGVLFDYYDPDTSCEEDVTAFMNAFDEYIRNAPKENLTLEGLAEQIAQLTDDERMDLFRNYCCHCGCKDPHCACWNDD